MLINIIVKYWLKNLHVENYDFVWVRSELHMHGIHLLFNSIK